MCSLFNLIHVLDIITDHDFRALPLNLSQNDGR